MLVLAVDSLRNSYDSDTGELQPLDQAQSISEIPLEPAGIVHKNAVERAGKKTLPPTDVLIQAGHLWHP